MKDESYLVPYTGPSITSLLGDIKHVAQPKPKKRVWLQQHTATPEHQQRRKEVAYMGIRQYKKLNRALRAYAQQGISTSTQGAN